MLEKVLAADFVPHLPPLLDASKPADQQARKNLSRAFAGFAISKLCEIPPKEAAASVVDDFDDYGIDAVYYHAASETLFVVQAKLKASETFSQEEALAFCQGVRKLVSQDFSGFNANVLKRQTELEDAVTSCSQIELVIAHTGSGISLHAKTAVADLIADDTHGEERFKGSVTDYDAIRVVADLQAAQAYPRVDATLVLQAWSSEAAPRQTYFGLVRVSDLVKLHATYDKALYAKNIRTFLGQATEVNAAIRGTLASQPEKFIYLNNGVTALCERIDPKENRKAGKRLKLTGVSVINGAQTIASSAQFVQSNAKQDISSARVLITLIKADGDSEFGKAVTRARNHQNPVQLANFAALDDEQERLRRDLALLGIHYAYKAEGPDCTHDPNRIRIDEAAHALALMQPDPRFAVWLKKEPAQLLDTERDPYKAMFTSKLTAFQLANAVRVFRYLQRRMVTEVATATGVEKLTYKHGVFGLGFILTKRLAKAIDGAVLIDSAKVLSALSLEFDALRQALWTAVQPRAVAKGPLALFRNQAEAIPILRDTMIAHYGLAADSAIAPLRAKVTPGELYPQALFAYLASKAPQIGNLT
ncbi:AIPR family protein [Methylocapsa acidiphila]|uniref:AIPR family protein n=1 Tax=Methylocapsa acidiphila TaxID=133552 RepID=UPI0018DC712C|nr:AIPR family protein [Methylocapsa acidiphila]